MDGLLTLLGIDVPVDLFRRWIAWVAPARQPFIVEVISELAGLNSTPDPTPELVDTYGLFGLATRNLTLVWLDETAFRALPRAIRSSLVRSQVTNRRALVPSVRAWRGQLGQKVGDQADGHRFVWWPDLLRDHEVDVITSFVVADPGSGRRRYASRHREVPASVWRGVERVVPCARDMAGRFPRGSGPNCFGTVMAAGGVEGARDIWKQREPFEDFVLTRTVPGGIDSAPGTVLIWRSSDGLAQHAAVTIGDGWALHKPSQSWASPVKVLAIEDLKRISREKGLRVQRRTLLPS